MDKGNNSKVCSLKPCGMNIAYNMDCIEGMKKYPDKYFDLAVVDPPYGIGESGDKNATRSCLAKSKDYMPFFGSDKEPPPPEYFSELFRVSKNQIIFGANHFISRISLDSPCWIVWDKQNGESDFADCELAWTSFKQAVRVFRYRWQGMLQGDMKNKEVRIHPTQKPVALYSWIFGKFCGAGYKILDTHLGSGSSRIAAYDMGMDFVWFEIHKGYFDKQEERFNAHAAQGNLFLMTDDKAKYEAVQDECRRQIGHAKPAADVAPVRHGRWIQHYEPYDTGEEWIEAPYGRECSECGRWEAEKEPFCNCGADMREVQSVD